MTSPRQNPTASGFITLDHDPLEARPAQPAFSEALRPPPGGGYDAPRRSGPGLRRPVRAPLWVVIAVAVVAGLVIGVGTHFWDASQVRRFQSGAVSVLLTVPGTSTFQTNGDGTTASLVGDLQVVNTGPRIIEVGQINSSTPGVTVDKVDNALVIPAGNAKSLKLSLKITCAEWSSSEPLVFLLVVRTVDNERRGYVAALALNETPWGNSLQTACTAPGGA